MLDIVFENKSLIVVNKPAGLTVNRSETARENTLQDGILEYLKLGKDDLGIGQRAGIVHRLDKETSGLIIVAKTEKAFALLQEQFKNREVEKEYIALVHGVIKNEALNVKNKIARIGSFGKFGVADSGRESETEIRIVASYEMSMENIERLLENQDLNKSRVRYLKHHAVFYTLVSAFPKTGRTHQIRVHLRHIGNPVVSDLIYTPSKLIKFDLLWCPRLFLHSTFIAFKDPDSRRKVSFRKDLPLDIANALKSLKENIN